MSTNLSIIIPTCGRETLNRTLRSVQNAGIDPNDEVIVVGDGPQPVADRICRVYRERVGLPVVYMDGPTTHGFGGAQRNLGMIAATREHLMFMDDDDEYVEGVFPHVRKVIQENLGKPIIAKMRHRTVGVIWINKIIQVGNIGTQMLIVPNVKERLAQWPDNYIAEVAFIEGVVEKCTKNGIPIFWWDHLIAIHHKCPDAPCRP
jgi:glycosyltransferase involved in cell wall biosynthesis